MSIKPVLVPDHTANDLRRLMDSFATASTGPTKQQLNENRAAVAAAQGVTEGARQKLNFDEIYGRYLKVTDNDGDPNKEGFSLVTPLNGESWNWRERPEFKKIVQQKLNEPGFLGDHKYQQIIDAMSGKKFDPARHLAKSVTEARNTYTVVFVDPSDGPKQIGKFNSVVEAKQLIRNSYREMYQAGDRLRNVAPGIYVLEEDYRNTGEQATADNYKHMYHWIIQKSSGVAEGSLQEHGDPWEDPNYDPRGGGETRSPEQIAKDNAEHEVLSKKLGLKNTNKLSDIKDDMLKMMNHFRSQHSDKKDVPEGEQGLDEKLGANRPKLGTGHDTGKSIRKWRKTRGFDESEMEEQIDEKSEAVRHANNRHDHQDTSHVDESIDPIDQLRADIKRFAR